MLYFGSGGWADCGCDASSRVSYLLRLVNAMN